MSVIKQLFRFLKTYSLGPMRAEGVSSRLIWRLWSVVYIAVIFYTFALTFLLPDIATTLQPVKLQEFILQGQVWSVVVLTVLLGPLMEELLFRAGMKRGGRNVSFLVGAIVFLIIKYFFGYWIDEHVTSQLAKSLSAYGLYIACVVICFHLLKPVFPKLSRIYARWPGRIFWMLTTGFALAHVSNFDISKGRDPMILLLIVPQLMLGVMLGFVRMQWGLGRSMVLHMFHNALQLIPILLIKQIVGPTGDILSLQTLSPEILSGSPWFIVAGLYALLFMGFIIYNIFQEIVSRNKTP